MHVSKCNCSKEMSSKLTVVFKYFQFVCQCTQGQINGLQREKMEAEQSFANVSHRQSYDIQNLNHQNQELVRQINELNGHLAVYR